MDSKSKQKAEKNLTPGAKLSPGQWKRPGRRGVGNVYGSGTLFMHREFGKATLGEDVDYDVRKGAKFEFGNFGFGEGGPAYVRDCKSGQWFELDWNSLVSLAIQNGIGRDYGESENGDQPADKLDGIDKQNVEFDAVSELAKQWRRIQMTSVVDDDYPSVRADYERAVRSLIDAFRTNGRVRK